MEDEDIASKLTSSAAEVNAFMDEVLTPRKPEILYEASRHLIAAGGKRLRPFLVLRSCEAVGGDPEHAIPFAAAMELLHNFTLIHDDVMDNDLLRRGAPTVHTKYGVSTAIAAGDLLFAKVYEAMTIHAPSSLSCRRIKNCIETAARATVELCEGQVLDMSFPSLDVVTEEDYIAMVGGKTGALFRACAEVGAIVGGGTKGQVRSLGRFAYEAGIAFQLYDDILGVTADEKTLGKPVGSDIREGKRTLIIIHALAHAKKKSEETIRPAIGNHAATRDQIETVLDALRETGSIDYAMKRAGRFSELSKRRLSRIPDSAAKADLLALVDYFTKRNY